MMNVTKHFKERFLERIENVTDQMEIKRRISIEDQELQDRGRKLHEFAQFIWKGQLGDNITRNFYINGDIILVTDVDNTTLITIYKCIFEVPEDFNKPMIDRYMKEIEKLQYELMELGEEVEAEVQNKQVACENIDIQIKALEGQIQALRTQKNALLEDIKAVYSKTRFISESITRWAVMLCNSRDYRQDIEKFKKSS